MHELVYFYSAALQLLAETTDLVTLQCLLASPGPSFMMEAWAGKALPNAECQINVGQK